MGNTSEFSRVLLAPPTPFQAGEVFVSGNLGFVQRFGPDGALRDLLRTDESGEPTYGMAFNPAGHLFVSGRQSSALTRFDGTGTLLGQFGGDLIAPRGGALQRQAMAEIGGEHVGMAGGASTTVTGRLSSRPNETFTIDFYASTEPDASGFGEGEFYLGAQEVLTDGAGAASFTVSFPGQRTFVTATATDARGRTSEFSPVAASSAPAPAMTITIGNNRRIRVNWPGAAAGFLLETTPSLAPPVTWTVVTPAPGVENGQFIHRTNLTTSAQFFRLRKP